MHLLVVLVYPRSMLKKKSLFLKQTIKLKEPKGFITSRIIYKFKFKLNQIRKARNQVEDTGFFL